MGRLHNESNAQSERLFTSKRNHAVDSLAEPDLLEAGKDDRQACLHLEPSNINQANRVRETRKTGQEMGRRPQHLLTTRWQRPHEGHDLPHHGGRQLEMGERLHNQQTQATSMTHDPYHHDYDNPTNIARPTNRYD